MPAPTDTKNDSGPSAAVDEIVRRISVEVKEPITEQIKAIDQKYVGLNTEFAQVKTDLNAVIKASQDKAGLPGYQKDQAALDPEDPRRFSLLRACWGHMNKWSQESGTKSFPEYEAVHDYRKIALAEREKAGSQVGIGDTGGLLVTTTMLPDLIKELEANIVAVAAGVEFASGLSGGPISLPRDEGGITAYRKGEGLPITESFNAFSQMEFRPLEVAARTRVSRSLLNQTRGRIRTILDRNLARKLALKMDLDFFSGGGGNTPNGILNASAVAGASTPTGAGLVYGPGAAQTVSAFLEAMVGALKGRNAYTGYGEVKWFANPLTFSAFRKTVDTTGQVVKLFDNMFSDAVNGVSQTDRLWGHRYAETTQLIGVDDTAQLLLFPVLAATMLMWETLEIFPSEHAVGAFENNELAIRAVAYNDSGIYRGDYLQRATLVSYS